MMKNTKPTEQESIWFQEFMKRNAHRLDKGLGNMPGLEEKDWDWLKQDKSLGLER